MDGAVVLLGLILEEGYIYRWFSPFFTPCSCPMQGPRWQDGSPAARLCPQRAGTNPPAPTALAADRGEGPLLCVHH